MNYFRLKHGDFAGFGTGVMIQYVSESNNLISFVDYVCFLNETQTVIINLELSELCLENGISSSEI